MKDNFDKTLKNLGMVFVCIIVVFVFVFLPYLVGHP